MNAEMTLYDYAKQVIVQEVPMDPITFSTKISELAEYIKEKDYCMLLCNERKDFTIFKNETSNHKDFTKTALSETISNRGLLLLADKQPDGAYELWIRDPATNENFAYYLFDYTNGIVEV